MNSFLVPVSQRSPEHSCLRASLTFLLFIVLKTDDYAQASPSLLFVQCQISSLVHMHMRYDTVCN